MDPNEKKCGTCRFGIFETDSETGGKEWAGLCAMHKSKKTLLLRVEQHFHCSNGNWRSKNETRVGLEEQTEQD